ncbi:MAG: DUF1667 domain-containing protein [Treponema sp.]|nr:DUF1667 domain-containing protein [Treponema sp.]
MRELTCIVCPIGCSLLVEEGPVDGEGFPSLTVTGNKCNRGAIYAQEEVRSPKRVVTATCGIVLPAGEVCPRRSLTAPRRLPVKTTAPCPKGKINELLGDIYRLKVSLPVKAGQKLITDWKGLGFDVVAVRSLA